MDLNLKNDLIQFKITTLNQFFLKKKMRFMTTNINFIYIE
jgi:hypothetical protein